VPCRCLVFSPTLTCSGESLFAEELARAERDTGDVYFVPAFSGLYAPYWETDARGVIVGLTNYTRKSHLCRATLEAVCFQSREVSRNGRPWLSTETREAFYLIECISFFVVVVFCCFFFFSILLFNFFKSCCEYRNGCVPSI